MSRDKKLKFNEVIKKISIASIAILLIFVMVEPVINSKILILKDNIFEQRDLSDQPIFDGLIDEVYLTDGEHIYFGNANYENFSGDLYVIDDVSIDPNYVWIIWLINPAFVDNTYGNGTVPQYVNTNGNPCGHNFNDLYESDRQEIKLYNENSNLVFYASMDLIHAVSGAPSGYGIPAWNSGESAVYYGDSNKVEYKTSISFDVNEYYNTPPYNVLSDSPTLGDEDYTLYPGYEDWEHRIIYELSVDRTLFDGSTIDVSATEFLNVHTSPNRIGPHSIPLYPICNSIGDYVWNDEDGDGIQDSDETGIDGVTVELYSCNDEFIDSTTTSNGGMYEISSFPTGNYYVKFILPTGYEFTLQDVGSNDEIDSDADPNTGETECIDFGSGSEYDTWDAGMFTTAEYTLTVNIDGSGSVTKDPDQTTYAPGTVVELTAVPDAGWSFSHWSGDLSGSDNPETIVMDDDKTVTAHFSEEEYTLTVVIDGNGSVIKDPDQTTYASGTVVELTAVPDAGWSFSHWSGDLTGSNNPEYITMDSDKTVTAHFTEDQYTITVINDGNGTVIKDPDQTTYTYGTVVELTAVPESRGWIFDHWSGDLTGSNNPEYITIDGDKTVTAHFTYVAEYTLTIIIDGECGWVIKNPDLPTYPHGTVVMLTAETISCFSFTHWSGDLTGSNNPEYITMDSDKTVTAHFVMNYYSLEIIIEGNGCVETVPEGPLYQCNANVTLTAIPDPGWAFSYWSGDIEGSENPTWIRMLWENKTVTAHFTTGEYTLDINVEGNGVVLKDPDHATHPYGEIVELTAVADSGWIFDHWSGDLSGDNNPETIFIDDNKDVTAYFTIAEPPDKPSIDGPTKGKIGVEYDYTFTTTDPYESDVYYYIGWGDSTFEDWFGPFASGEEVTISHSWSEKDQYTIKAKARNTYDSESDWATLQVNMPRNRTLTNTLFLNFLKNHPQLIPILRLLLTRFGDYKLK